MKRKRSERKDKKNCIRVRILGRGACSFLVKNPKKIKSWILICDKSNPMTYTSCCPTYKWV